MEIAFRLVFSAPVVTATKTTALSADNHQQDPPFTSTVVSSPFKSTSSLAMRMHKSVLLYFVAGDTSYPGAVVSEVGQSVHMWTVGLKNLKRDRGVLG